MKKRKIVGTDDGSTSVFDPAVGQNFHSVFGAVAESQHIFIKSALEFYGLKNEINILEAGFGTGLNALLAFEFSRKRNVKIQYHSIEKFPLTKDEWSKLSFWPPLKDDFVDFHVLEKLHLSVWDEVVDIAEGFLLKKITGDIGAMKLPVNFFDVVFFDAFSPDMQPELWTVDVFENICKSMIPGGVLTTYSVKGDVKRAMKTAGFKIEKIPGPKGKREILRAVKP